MNELVRFLSSQDRQKIVLKLKKDVLTIQNDHQQNKITLEELKQHEHEVSFQLSPQQMLESLIN